MFQTILEFIKSNFLLSENDQMEIEKFLKSMEVTSAKLEQKMKLIGKKYNYENLNNLRAPTSYDVTNTLFFWRELFELQISIALDEEEMDNDFMLFINENDIYNPVIRLENSELEKVCFDTFHSWVGFGFQKAQLFNCGIPMGITVNSDIVSYYFNDFSYDNFSNYHRVYEINKRVSRPFKRDLKIEEIFIRTHIINYSYKEIKLVSSNNKKKNIVELKNSVFKSRVLDLNTNDTIENEEKLKLGNPYERKESSGIDVIIKYFESTVNEGMSFNLNECKYEK